jgi:hypothetical protein
MKITVLWEDSRHGVSKGFGPHELLLSCLVDELDIDRDHLKPRVDSQPKNGNASLRKALQKDLRRISKSGPVVAVLDKDKIHDLWPPSPPRPDCISGITARFRQDAQGDYDLVLIENIEALIEAACDVIGHDVPPKGHDARDRLLARVAWETPQTRHAIRDRCPSFARIVTRVARHLRP